MRNMLGNLKKLFSEDRSKMHCSLLDQRVVFCSIFTHYLLITSQAFCQIHIILAIAKKLH